eukprot:scaffold149231_cov20-Cyclotella_meneghiniana.AAC.1
MLKTNEHSLTNVDHKGNLPLHVRNKEKKLPIELLLFDAICDRNLQYVDAVDSFFRANPVDSVVL